MLRFWECFSGALLCEHFTAHQQGESVAALAVAPDNSTVVTADTAGYIMVRGRGRQQLLIAAGIDTCLLCAALLPAST
jgi:hypothetical protein